MGRSAKDITVKIDISDKPSSGFENRWQSATELLLIAEQRLFVVSSPACSGVM